MGRNQNSTQWTDEAVGKLRALWDQGVRCGAIAALINTEHGCSFTRNSIIGKAHRLQLPQRHRSPLSHLTPEQRIHRRRERHERWRREHGIPSRSEPRPRRDPPVSITLIEDNQIPMGQRKSLFELENCHCRWPVGEVGVPGFFFCGAPEADMRNGRSYCPAHSWRGTSIRTENKRAA